MDTNLLTKSTLNLVDFELRPARMDDVENVVRTLNACSRELQGYDLHTVEDFSSDWESPGFELDRDTILVITSEGEVAGYIEVWDPSAPHIRMNCWGRVHPRQQGKGIGSAMVNWAEERSKQSLNLAPEGTRVSMLSFIPSVDKAAEHLYLSQGFSLVRYNLRMVIELESSPEKPVYLTGIQIRSMVVNQDEPVVIRVMRDSFKDHWGYVDHPFEEDMQRWQHFMETSPLFDPDLWFIAYDGNEAVGISFCYLNLPETPGLGWVSSLGVLRPWRKQGLGLALLQHSFCELYQRGKTKIGLGVDAQNLTGALRLYYRAGMRPDPAFQLSVFEKELREGVELSTQNL